jgi:hypothetical protein
MLREVWRSMDNKSKKSYERREPTVMTHQLYIFADAYFYATGRDRTFKQAALKAGATEGSSAAQGHYWSKFNVVQEYWKALQENTEFTRQKVNSSVYSELEHIALTDPSLKLPEKIALLLQLAEMTDKALAPNPIAISGESKSSKGDPKPDDENTVSTMNQVWESIKASANRRVGEDNA